MKKFLFVFPLALLCVTACQSRSTLGSVPIEMTGPVNLKQPPGPVYFLPMTVLEIEGAPCLKSETKDGGASPSAAKDPAAASTVVNVVNNNGEKPPAPKPDAAPTPELAKCDKTDPNADYGIRTTWRTVPDPSAGYQVRFPLANVSSNKPVVKIDSNGLLTSANTVSKDETRETIVNFGKSIGTLAGLAGYSITFKNNTFANVPDLREYIQKPAGKPKPKIHKFCVVESLADVTLTCKAASTADEAAAVTVTLFDTSPAIEGPAATSDCSDLQKLDCKRGALMHRARAGVLTTIEVGEKAAPEATPIFFARTSALIPVIDRSRVYAVTAVARPFVQSETKLTFDKGVLTGFEGDYPSTGGAIASLPADFIGSIFSGFANAISLRGDAATSEADLLKAETELLKAQIELEAARRQAEE